MTDLRPRIRPTLLALALALSGSGCGLPDLVGLGDDDGPTLRPAGVRILFVGNSLTYTNNLPDVVRRLADAAGKDVAVASIAEPNWSLEDHWNAGLEGEIRRLKPDVVVMQQGPSTRPANREHLAHWAGRIGAVVREAGGQPALLMVWPGASNTWFFGEVAVSYEEAAVAAGGVFIPAGASWVRAWEIDGSLGLYGPDAFHPSYLGTLAAAHTVVAVLLDVPPSLMPALDDGVATGHVEILRRAVARATGVSPFASSAAGLRTWSPGPAGSGR